MHSPVSVKTHCGSIYEGTLLAIDQYLNVVLQNATVNADIKKGFLFVKGSNILLLTLIE
ncbi:U6 snRNA-associated Sm-like protein LSm6 [Nematocida ausubeli]|nr:uncharacterized protein NESG_02158 [Nematocida ausubeli]KAI5134455.1 U6 snRNA-associated Sm-like protein LSm6 [Nematocida ausubeli]KAI5160113.1 U6 snRNA-associated Sm-like protein LSm6 [Nematocida ausubeli]KFG25384.1 hypothetical protein NESG_02158 [Nematocida ausubeli]